RYQLSPSGTTRSLTHTPTSDRDTLSLHDALPISSTERTGKVEMNDLTKRKKTLPVVVGFERAQGKTRERLAALFAPPAPLSSESAEQIREILDELGVRALIDAEIESQRGRALHALSGIAPRV